MSDPIKLWKYRIDKDAQEFVVVEVECPNGRFPERDADGETVYDNTHFDTRAQAVRACHDSATAQCRYIALSIRSARDHLQRLEMDAADACVFLESAERLESAP